MDVNIYSRGKDTEKLIARCRELKVTSVGYACADMPGFADSGVPDAAQLRERVNQLRDAGIAVPLAVKWFGVDPMLVLKPRAHRVEIDAAKRTFEIVGSLGIPTVLHYVDLAQSQDPADDERYWEGLIGVFGELVQAATDANVRLANHAIWRCIPDPLRSQALADGVTMATYRQYRPAGWRGPYLLNSAEHIQRLLEAVPSPNNGVCFCTGMQIMGGDMPELVGVFAGKIFYAQMRDQRGRWPASEEVFPGTGEIDFPTILTRLPHAGYDGAFGPEHFGPPRFPGDDLEAAAAAYFQALLARLAA